MLAITHSPEEGTLIEGTSRGDGAGDILKANRWRWSRMLGAWYVPRSRDAAPKTALIDATANALRAAGFEVSVIIDAARRPTAQVEADRIERQAARAEALATKADTAHQAASAASERADTLAGQVPFGQPILTDHYSAGKMRRHYDQVHRAARAEHEAYQAADTAQTRADSAAHTTAARYAPVTVANRVQDRAARLRKAEREGRHDQAEQLRDELDYWQRIRTEQIATGQATEHGPDTIRPGDLIQVSGSIWWKVEKVNRKTVRVGEHGSGWQHTVPYHHITNHHRPSPHESSG